jgi:hypothetical protein
VRSSALIAVPEFDLNLEGSGEIAAAISLVQTICLLLGIGTYRRNSAEREVLYVQVPSTSAQRAADTLKEYGFRGPCRRS